MTRFPAGRYYVGDLCYVIGEWDKFCDMTITSKGECLDGYFKWKTGFLWTHGTAYGDGCFLDNHGREYCVDAGLIGVIPFEFVSKASSNGTPIDDLGHIIVFDKPFTCEYEGGKFYIGDDICIDTDPKYTEDDEDEDE